MSADVTQQAITEFLLARVAEDEAVAVSVRDGFDPLDWAEPGPRVGGAWGIEGPVDGPSGYTSIVIDPARVLAECAAKRVALDWYANDDDTVMRPTIKALAAVYADHPDYRDKWRP